MSTTQPIRNQKELKQFKSYYQYVKPNLRNYSLIIIGLNSALRISDILHLTYNDVYDFRQNQWRSHIIVLEQKTQKTNKIYMNREIRTVLHTIMDETAHTPDEWIFKSQKQDAEPLSRSQAFRIVKEAASYAGLSQNISCHSLRKTFGYYAWKQGASPILLMNIYNHSSFQVTKRYLGIEQDDKDQVFKSIRI